MLFSLYKKYLAFFFFSHIIFSIPTVCLDKNHTPTSADKQHFITMWFGYILSRALYSAAELRLADYINEKPVSIEQLAGELDCDPASLYRLLRMLASHGVFAETSSKEFIATPLSNFLKTESSDSLVDAILGDDDIRWNAFGALTEAIKSGKPPFDSIYGETYFDFIASSPEHAENFNKHMSSLTKTEDVELVERLNLEAASKIVDIGGGKGGFLATLLKKYPSAHGVLFDLPEVVEQESNLLIEEVKDRCLIQAGSFFDSLPERADAYILKRILHDWDDEKCKIILKNCYEKLSPHAILYIIEPIIPEGNERHLSKDVDLLLMSIFSGRERTQKELEFLLESEHLKLNKIYQVGAVVSVLEISRAF